MLPGYALFAKSRTNLQYLLKESVLNTWMVIKKNKKDAAYMLYQSALLHINLAIQCLTVTAAGRLLFLAPAPPGRQGALAAEDRTGTTKSRLQQ